MPRDKYTPTPGELGIAPEAREGEKRIEIEVKIIRTKPEDYTPKGLQKKIEALGGSLEIPRRLLEDINYAVDKKQKGERKTFLFNTQDFENPEGLERVFTLLGLTIVRRKEKELAVRTPGGLLPKRTVRLRRDGEQYTLTVKVPREKGKAIDERPEEEVGVVRPEAVDIIMKTLGFRRDTERQKYRTTFRLGKTHIELNEGPKAPPWIEVEGDPEQQATAQDMFDTVERLGYTKADTASISDADYYRTHGISDDELRNLKFSS